MMPRFTFTDIESRNPLRRNDRSRPIRILIDPKLLMGTGSEDAKFLENFLKSPESRHTSISLQ
jgi:hypothetical protein